MKLQFIEDIERDIKNWQNSVAVKSYGVDWKKFLPDDISVKKVYNDKYLKNYLGKKFYRLGKIFEFRNWLEHNVNFIRLQKDLEILVGKKFPSKTIKVFITTFHRAPYSFEKSFFYIIWRNSKNREKAITNIYHELMHFLFHWHYWDLCKKAGLSETQIHVLKESLTVLLNPILKQRELPIDFGYPSHQEIRAKIKEMWRNAKNFDLILKQVQKILK